MTRHGDASVDRPTRVRHIVGGVDVTDHVRANVARFGSLDDASPETQERLRALFGPAIAAARADAERPRSTPSAVAEAA